MVPLEHGLPESKQTVVMAEETTVAHQLFSPNRQDLHYDLKYYRTALAIIGFTRNDAYLVQPFSFTFTVYPHHHRAAHVGFKVRSATIMDSRKGDGDPWQMNRSATPRDRFRHLATRAQSVVNLLSYSGYA